MTINLKKGEKISLTKQAGGGLRRIALGVGWDPVEKPKKGLLGMFGGGAPQDIDLDASCILYSRGRQVDQVWFRQLRSKDGSVSHSGDNLTGEGDGDDEVITVDLQRLPAEVDALVLTVNSFRGQTFDIVKTAHGRVVDADSGKEIAKYVLSDQGRHTGMIIAVVRREGNEWTVKAIGERAQGRTFHEMNAQMAQLAA